MFTPYTLKVPRVGAVWPPLDGATVAVDKFHPESGDHRPTVQARIAHDDRSLLLRFDVADRYVLARATEHQQMVCRDSCVEFFVQPVQGKGYFNFEANCGGTIRVHYVQDWRRMGEDLAKSTPLSAAELATIGVDASMPRIVWPEIPESTKWSIDLRIPLAIMEPYVGPIGALSGQTFRGNFYKCADRSSHPHWASWAPIGEQLNFHQPRYFGSLTFQ